MNFLRSKNFIIFLAVIIVLLYLSQYIFPEPTVEEISPEATEVKTPQEP